MTVTVELRNHMSMAIRNPSDKHVSVSRSSYARHVVARNGAIKDRALSVISQDRVESEIALIEPLEAPVPDSVADDDASDLIDFRALAVQELQVIQRALAVCERITAKLSSHS